MTADGWLFLFAAIGALGGLATMADVSLKLSDRLLHGGAPPARKQTSASSRQTQSNGVALSKPRFAVIFVLLLTSGALSVGGFISSISESSRLNRPHLIGTINQIATGPSPRSPIDTAVFLAAKIRNTGMPSGVEDYRLMLSFPGQPDIVARYMGEPTDKFMMTYPDGQRVSYPKEDFLVTKTTDTAIPTGGIATGVLFFELKNVNEGATLVPGGTWTLTFVDVEGTQYKAIMPTSNRDDPAGSLPGLHEVLMPSASPSPKPTASPK
jgi:hypothetical protein